MKGKFRILGRIGLGVFMVCALMLAFMPVAPVSAATAVTEVSVDFPYVDARNTCANSTTNVYIVHFKATTALSRGVDYVTVTFPDGSEAMGGDGNTGGDYVFTISSPTYDDVLFSTNYDTTDLVIGATWKRTTTTPIAGGTRVKTRLPIDVAAGQDVWVKFDDSDDSGAMTAATAEASTYKVYVSTTKDTTPVLSSTFALGNSTVNAGDTSVYTGYPLPATAGSTATYVIKFSPTTTIVASTTKVTVKFPMQATVPSSLSITDVGFGTAAGTYTSTPEAPVVNVNTREVTAISSLGVTADPGNTYFYMEIKGITNPTIADSSTYKVMVRTSLDGKWECASGDPITASALNKVIVANGEIGTPTSIYSDDATMVDMYSSQIYLALGDQYGNAKAPSSGVTVTLSSSSSTGAFYWLDAYNDMQATVTSCTSVTVLVQDPNVADGGTGSGDQIVYYKDSTAGTHTLTFSATAYADAEWTFTVCPGVAVYDSADNLVSTYKPLATAPTAENGDGDPYTQKYSVDYINDAVTGAMTGDTVKLGDGIYELDTYINLNKKVTLTSVNGASKTTLRNTTTINEAILAGISGTATNPVIIDGLTIERLRYGTEIRNAIWSKAYDYVTVRNCTFNYIMPDEDKDEKEGVVALVSSLCTANLESLTVSNNTFNNCCTNVWPNMGDNEWDWGACINVMSSHTGYTVKGVTISGNTLTNCDGYGIAVGGMSASATLTGKVTNNTFTDCFIGICSSGFSPAAGYSLTGNTITGAYHWAIELEGSSNGDIIVKNNTITGCALVDNESAIRIPGESDLAAATYCHYIQYNDIYDNASGTYSIKVTTATDVLVTDINCNYNYFGDASGPYYSAVTGAVVTKSNPNGTGAKVSDGVYYYPWLHKPVADVVADNVSWQTSTMKLVAGWNTLSTPVPLIAAADTVDELIPSGMTIGYYYDGGWTQILTGYTLSPCDAVYVKMDEAKYVQLKFECETFSTPSKDLAVGWNLCSLASLDSDGMRMDYAVASVALNSAGLPGYGQVVSPSLNATRYDMYYNAGTSWASAYGETSTAGTMYAGMGYWIYMQNAATLAGFEITPIAPDLD